MDTAIAPHAHGHGHGHGHTPERGVPRDQRLSRLAGLAGAIGVTAYVGLVDPSTGGAYPLCPSRVLFGLDCPACGGLRGTHDLVRGDVAAALDHNLLLPLWLGLAAAAVAVWLLPLAGRRAPALRPPRWLLLGAAALAAAFTVLRNVPVAGLEFLAAGA
jgi:hypothetical protein